MTAVNGAPDSGLRIEVLGPVRAVHGGRELASGPPLRQAVLAVLALRANHPVSRDEIIDAVWGDAPPASAANNLHIYISALRRDLASGPEGGAAATRILPGGRSGYLLRLAPGQLDVAEFEEHLNRARARVADGERRAGTDPDHRPRPVARCARFTQPGVERQGWSIDRSGAPAYR
jgi:DNA-binding SARP family transcriptional activator